MDSQLEIHRICIDSILFSTGLGCNYLICISKVLCIRQCKKQKEMPSDRFGELTELLLLEARKARDFIYLRLSVAQEMAPSS